jgi:hypothetical protein
MTSFVAAHLVCDERFRVNWTHCRKAAQFGPKAQTAKGR